jgi:hypothetical protein
VVGRCQSSSVVVGCSPPPSVSSSVTDQIVVTVAASSVVAGINGPSFFCAISKLGFPHFLLVRVHKEIWQGDRQGKIRERNAPP